MHPRPSPPDDPPLSQAEADHLRDEVIRHMANTPPKPKGESRGMKEKLMIYRVTVIISGSGTPSYDATPYSSIDSAMDSVCKKLQMGLLSDCWIEDANGRRIANMEEIRNFCFANDRSF